MATIERFSTILAILDQILRKPPKNIALETLLMPQNCLNILFLTDFMSKIMLEAFFMLIKMATRP